MTDNEIGQIRQFVSRHADGAALDDDQDLFDDGYVNSLFVVQLVMWIERTFDVQIERGDLDFVNFRTISAIASLVAHKGAAEVQPSGAAAREQSWTSA
jgi:methoxymalonate biosynthesis acyl carrier protein